MLNYTIIKTHSLILLSLTVIFLSACSSENQKSKTKEKVTEAKPKETKAEPVKEAEVEVSYESLKSLIDSGSPIPMAHFSKKDIFPKNSSYEISFTFIQDLSDQIVGWLEAVNLEAPAEKEVYIAAFSHRNGRLRNYKSFGTIPSNRTLEEVFLTDIWQEKYLVSRKDTRPGEASVYILGSFKIEVLDSLSINYEELVKLSKDSSQLPWKYIWNHDAGNRKKESEYKFTIDYLHETPDFLVAKVYTFYKRWAKEDYMDVSLVSFSKSNNGLYKSFQGVTSIEKKREKFRTYSVELDDDQLRKYKLTVSDYSEYHEGNNQIRLVHDRTDTRNFYLQDDGELLDIEYIPIKQYGFLDFIKRFKEGGDKRAYQKEDYFFEFMEKSYGGPITMIHLLSSEKAQVFLSIWGEMETEAREIWVYNNKGQRISSCHGLPANDFAIAIQEFQIDTLSLAPAELEFNVSWNQHEVIDTGEMPETGDLINTHNDTFILRIDDQLNCKMVKK